MPDDRFNEYCENLLAQYKRRNTPTVTQRLESLCGFLRQKGNVVQSKFGGSVQKGTYVTGLSDVDVLLIVNQFSLVNQPPSKIKNYVRDAIKRRLPNNPVQACKLAVTVKYSDKTEIQLLPAITDKDWRRSDRPTRKPQVEQNRAPRKVCREARQSQHGEKRQSSSGNQACQGDGGLLHHPSKQED